MIDGTVGVPAAVRAVVSIRVIGAIRAIVGVSVGTIAVVARVVPSPVVDIGIVVVDDGRTTAAPVHVPGVPAPAATPTPNSNRDTGPKVETNRSYRHRWRHVQRNHYWRAVNRSRIILRYINYLRVCWLNHDGIGRRCSDRDLRIGLQASRRLSLGAHGLYCCHHIALLIRKRLPEA